MYDISRDIDPRSQLHSKSHPTISLRSDRMTCAYLHTRLLTADTIESFWSTWPIMKGAVLLLLTLLLCIYHLDAFLTNPYHPRTREIAVLFQNNNAHDAAATSDHDNDNNNNNNNNKKTRNAHAHAHSVLLLSHKDIIWKLRPPPETTTLEQLTLRLASNIIRLECILKGVDPPFCLCPKGGKATLEAHVMVSGSGSNSSTTTTTTKKRDRVGKFGITTLRGPPAEPINESVEELYGIDLQGRSVGSAAIIYMSVEPSHRHRGIGALALEVISAIHAMQGVDFTLLVADDDGSGRLVAWYEAHGFKRAPKLQDMLGSPGGKYGVTMIGPTNSQLSPSCQLQWW